jgi:hypothetical protein
MLGRPQGQSGRVRKILLPPRFDRRTVQSVASRYTDWAIPAPSGYWDCLYSREKRLLASSCLFVRLCLSVCAYYERSSRWRVSVKIRILKKYVEKIQIRLKSGKMSGTLYEYLSMFYSFQRHKFDMKLMLCKLSTFILLTLRCSTTIHREHIVTFLLQACLRQTGHNAAFLYVHCLVHILLWTGCCEHEYKMWKQ